MVGFREGAMVEIVTTEFSADAEESDSVSAVSWGAVLAGGVASAALTLLLLALGTGLGFSVVSPWPNSGVSSSTFGLATGLYLVVVAMIASSIGGYLAGRLRTKWVGAHSHEVYFRDTAHGFLSWAFATVVSVVVLASAATSIINGAATVTSGAASRSVGPVDSYVDTLLRSDPAAQRNPAEVAASRAELVRLLTPSFLNGGELAQAEQTYVAQVVAARTGLSQADAEKRVNDVIAQAKTSADEARKIARNIALWLTISMLVGAFCASLAATEGGGLRDGTWKY
jgi:hypothetical protein